MNSILNSTKQVKVIIKCGFLTLFMFLKVTTANPNESYALNFAGPANNDTVIAWGTNSQGQLSVPKGLTGVKAIAAGAFHTIALKEDGSIVGWGRNYFGQLDIPEDLGKIKAIDAAGDNTVVLKEDGTLAAWGENKYGELDIPIGLKNVQAISAGESFIVALKEDGTVTAWGNNTYMGIDGITEVPKGLSGVKAIAAGGGHTVALKEDGTIVEWGVLYSGEHHPKDLSNVKAIVAGDRRSAALKEDGTVVTWGNDYFTYPITPPSDLENVKKIACSPLTFFAIREDGSVVGWADNKGWGNNSKTKMRVKLTGVKAIAVGATHVVAVLERPFSIVKTQRVKETPKFHLSMRGNIMSFSHHLPIGTILSLRNIKNQIVFKTPVEGTSTPIPLTLKKEMVFWKLENMTTSRGRLFPE